MQKHPPRWRCISPDCTLLPGTGYPGVCPKCGKHRIDISDVAARQPPPEAPAKQVHLRELLPDWPSWPLLSARKPRPLGG